MHRGLEQLPILGEQAFALLHTLSTSDSPFVCAQSIETLSASIIEQLRKSGLTDSTSDFLLDHGPQIQKRIKDERLRNMVPWSE
jgi:hypothetical protein